MEDNSSSNRASSFPSIGSLFNETWQTFTQSILNLFLLNIVGIVIYLTLAVLAVLVFIISGAGSFLLQKGPEGLATNPSSIVPLMVIGTVFGLIFLIVGTALQIASILIVDASGKTSVGNSLKRSFAFIIPLFLTGILIFILMFGAFFLFILPAILFYLLLIFVQFEVVLNNQRWLGAVRRSIFVVSKNFGAILIRLIIIILIYLAIAVVIPSILNRIGPEVQIFVGIISFLINLLLGWYMLVYTITLYKQARAGLEQEKGKGVLWMWIVAIIGWLIAAGVFFMGYKAVSSGILNNALNSLIKKEERNFRTSNGQPYIVNSLIKGGELKLASFNQLNEKTNQTSADQTQMKLLANEALSYFEQATQADPQNTTAWYYLGETYSIMIQYDESFAYKAVDALNSALALKPDDELSYYSLAGIYMKINDYPNAIVVYQKWLKANPKNANAHYLLGLAYKRNGQINEAKNAFNIALDLLPQNDAKNRTLVEKELGGL